MTIAAALVLLLTTGFGTVASAGDSSITAPETGSSLPREVAHWNLPLDKTYEELTPEEAAWLRNTYVDMPADDEPPYPLHGMRDIVEQFVKAQNGMGMSGHFYATVRVDEKGAGRSLLIYETPDKAFDKIAAFILMKKVTYKPARCSGKPCTMDFPVTSDFVVTPPRFN